MAAHVPRGSGRSRGGEAGKRPKIQGAALMRALLLILAPVALAGCPDNEAGVAVPVDYASLYRSHCARCHGADGRGEASARQTMPALADFGSALVQMRRAEEIERVIMMGRGAMPAFGTSLSGPKIQGMAGFVRRLGQSSRMGAAGAAPGVPGTGGTDDAAAAGGAVGEPSPSE